jgi:hypothetical protein
MRQDNLVGAADLFSNHPSVDGSSLAAKSCRHTTSTCVGRPEALEAAERREPEVQAAGVGGGVIELQRHVGADHGEIAQRAAKRR